MLLCIDSLHIDPENLQRSNSLGRIINIYASDEANMPQVIGIARQIKEKWSRMIFGIQTGYDE